MSDKKSKSKPTLKPSVPTSTKLEFRVRDPEDEAESVGLETDDASAFPGGTAEEHKTVDPSADDSGDDESPKASPPDADKLKIPRRNPSPPSNPGGLFGDPQVPTSLPPMPVLTAKDATEFHAWRNKAKAWMQANGVSEYVLKDNRASLQRALNDDQGNRAPYNVRAIWIRVQSKVFGVMRTAVEARIGTAFFDKLEALGEVDVSDEPVDSLAWVPQFKWGNAHYLWRRLEQELMAFHPHDLAALVGKYLALQFHIGADPVAFNNSFEAIVREMEIAGLALPAKLHMAVWYRALPDELGPLKQSLSTNPNLTHQQIYRALVAHTQASKHNKKKAHSPQLPPDIDHVAAAIEAEHGKQRQRPLRPNRRGDWRPRQRPEGANTWCEWCGTATHNTTECYSMPKARQALLGSNSANVAIEEEAEQCAVFLDASDPDVAGLLDPPSERTDAEYVGAAIENESKKRTQYFIFDSGATTHLVSDKSLLTGVRDVPETNMSTAVRGRNATIRQRGTVQLNDKWKLLDVAHVAGAQTNLISEGRLCDGGYSVLKTKDFVRVMKDGRVMLNGFRVGKLWVYPVGGSKAAPAARPINTLAAVKRTTPTEEKAPPTQHHAAPKRATAQASATPAPGAAGQK
jgi:hypothetical protein